MPYVLKGHQSISVDNIEKACERFEKLGVNFKKRLTDGKMNHIAFILDPDGYWVEVSFYTHCIFRATETNNTSMYLDRSHQAQLEGWRGLTQ